MSHKLLVGEVGDLAPEKSFQTIAVHGADACATIAALEAGRCCSLLDEAPARRLEDLLSGGGLETGGPVLAFRTFADGDGSVEVADLRSQLSCGAAASQGAAISVVDNRGATPYLCRPLRMGADVVVEDAAELLGDAGAGGRRLMAISRSERALGALTGLLGGGVAPQGRSCLAEAARLGISTLSMRVQRACDSALALAHYASKHPLVGRVSYPGLPDDPSNGAARRTLEHGFGRRVVIWTAAASHAFEAGGPAQSTRVSCDGRGRLTVTCGLESPLDIVAMIESAIAAVGAV